ncbi:MAG: hypothetical protein J6C19_05640 [Lachnospiraceae bacterium]|nr:hypothetical protein [Lachnospiraceae bacterium]
MAEFYAAATTNLGIEFSTDLLVGERIEFTKLVTGSGVYSEEEINRSSLQKAQALRNPMQEFGFSNIEKVTDTCVLLKSLLSNRQLTEGYRMTEIGIYARKPGEEGDGILYSIAVAKDADYFPAYNGIAAVEIIEEYYITVSDTAEVSIQTGKGASVLLEDFERFKEEIRNELHSGLDKEISDLQKQIGDLSKLITENKCCLVDAINEIAEVIRPLVEYSIATDQDIEDIIAGIYADDIDWITMLDIASDRDIELIISEAYVDSEDDESDAATDQDIDDIIAGTYIDEIESEEVDMTEKEIEQIIENTFKEE